MTVTARAVIATAILSCTLMSSALAKTGWLEHQQLTLSCADGRQYPLRARAVTVAGEVVTGYLVVSPRQRVHMRLIPMGDGYRYAGRGVWFDGIRGDAQLFSGPSRSMPCSVVAG